MKIKSNMIFNTSLLARHAPAVVEGKVVIGGSAVESIVIPAGACLELDDLAWAKFAEAAKPLLKAKKLEMLVAPKKTIEQIAADEAAEIEAAKAVLKKAEEKAKAEKAAAEKEAAEKAAAEKAAKAEKADK